MSLFLFSSVTYLYHGTYRNTRIIVTGVFRAGRSAFRLLMPICLLLTLIGFHEFLWLVSIALPASRRRELEADRRGLLMAAKACADVRQGQTFWAGQKNNHGRWYSQLLSTHPEPRIRAQKMADLVPQAWDVWKTSGCGGRVWIQKMLKFPD